VDWAQDNPLELVLSGQIGSATDTKHALTSALLDDGAQINCISEKCVRQSFLTPIPLAQAWIAKGYNGLPAERVTHHVEFYLNINGHLEHTEALVTKSCGRHELILGYGWRATHQPTISHRTGLVQFNDTHCQGLCNPTHKPAPEVYCKGFKPPPDDPKPAKDKQKEGVADPTPPRTGPNGLPCLADLEGINKEHGIDIRLVTRKAITSYSCLKKSTTFLVVGTKAFEIEHEFHKVAMDEDYEKFMRGPDKSDPASLIPKEYQEAIDSFSREKADILADHGPFDHEIKLKPGAKLPNAKLRTLDPKQLDAIFAHLQELQAKGFIEPSNSPVKSALLIVQKPGGGIRVCVDYRELNEATIKDCYPIPFFRKTMAKLSKAKFFSKVDVIHAFNRMRMKPGNEWLTSFATRWGTFQYKVMPFGLCNAPATFQRAINDALAGLFDNFCTAYLDDVLIYSETLEDHQKHVLQVLERLKSRGFYLDVSKCVFNATRVKFLGMIITNNGIEMDPEKVDAIQKLEMPQSIPAILSFLGLTGWYRRFIKGYSTISLPPTNAVKSTTNVTTSPKTGKETRHVKYPPFTATQEHIDAFEALKKAFLENVVLAHYDYTKETFVMTDASGWASGGVLKQRDDNGDLRPIAYFSKKHSPAECNYDIYDLELMAIIKAFQEWEPELIGAAPDKPIQVISDHKNLQTFMSTKNLNRHQARWSLFLSQFNFCISYLQGKDNTEADLCSHCEQDMPKDDSDLRITETAQIILKPRNVEPSLALAIETAIRLLSLWSDDRDVDHIPTTNLREIRLCFTGFDEDPENPD
jgi:hypothetical protein